MLQIKDLVFSFPDKEFQLTIPELTVEQGELIGLVGGNGSGKTTLFKLLSGLYCASKGEFIYQGQPYNSILETSLTIVMHNAYGSLNPMLTVFQEVMLVASLYGIANKEDTIRDYSQQLGCEQLLHKYPRELSAGQKQKGMLLRTLSSSPDVVLLDEPTTGLDVCAIENVISWIELLKKQNKTVIVSSHHPYELTSLKPRLIGLKRGEIKINQSFTDEMDSPNKIREMITTLITNEGESNELATY